MILHCRYWLAEFGRKLGRNLLTTHWKSVVAAALEFSVQLWLVYGFYCCFRDNGKQNKFRWMGNMLVALSFGQTLTADLYVIQSSFWTYLDFIAFILCTVKDHQYFSNSNLLFTTQNNKKILQNTENIQLNPAVTIEIEKYGCWLNTELKLSAKCHTLRPSCENVRLHNYLKCTKWTDSVLCYAINQSIS